MPVFLQIAGFICVTFAFTLLARPRIRPSPATYGFAIALDVCALGFIAGVMILWPATWLLFPLLLWAAALVMHIHRFRDARVMTRVLHATYPAVRDRVRAPRPYDEAEGWRPPHQWP
ncbi:hypothetical protein [Streptomyces noursei]